MSTLTDHLAEAIAHADSLASDPNGKAVVHASPPDHLRTSSQEPPVFSIETTDPRVIDAAGVIAANPLLHTIMRGEEDFPQAFRDHAPEVAVLFIYGNLDAYKRLLTGPSYAIVGARRASAYGREVAYSLANELAAAGVTTISGMALGVDGAGARGSLQGGTPPVAFLAGSPAEAYPRSHRLLHEQITKNGCAISVTPPGITTTRGSFIYRSKLMGLLADATVFVEGSDDSGAVHTIEGSETAEHPVFAVPGPITGPLSTGPNGCIATGRARVARSIADLDVDYPPPPAPGTSNPNDLDQLEGHVYCLIGAGIATPREILEQTPDATGREIATALGTLELQGLVSRHDGGIYITLR